MQIALLVVLGLAIGPFLNFAIYAFAYWGEPLSPWQTDPKRSHPLQ